jgi:hypothetical protein
VKDIEGGAAGAGGLFSGETLEELERMRHGLVATDRAQQMSELFGLAGMGQGAATDAAALRRGFSQDVSGIHGGSAADIAGLRRGFAGDRAGIRGDYAGAIAGERSGAADDMNALRQYLTGMGINVQDRNLGTMLGLRDAYDTSLRGAESGYADTNLGILSDWMTNRNNAFNSRMASIVGASPMVNTAANSSLAAGEAGAASALGIGNSLVGGLMNGIDVYSALGGTWGQPQGNAPLTAVNPMNRPA